MIKSLPTLRCCLEEFRGHHRAHQMNGLIWSRCAAAIAIETGNRVCAAVLQFAPEDIRFTVHTQGGMERETGGVSPLHPSPPPPPTPVWPDLR